MKLPMSIAEYEEWVEAERTPYDDRISYDIIALSGEAGEISSTWKDNAKGRYSSVGDYSEDILLECGDTLHYLVRVLSDHGFTVQEAIDANVEKLTNRKKYGKGKHGKRS